MKIKLSIYQQRFHGKDGLSLRTLRAHNKDGKIPGGYIDSYNRHYVDMTVHDEFDLVKNNAKKAKESLPEHLQNEV